MVRLSPENDESWSSLALFFLPCWPALLAGGLSNRYKLQMLCCALPEKHSASKRQTWYVNPILFNAVYSWYGLYRPFIQGYLEAGSDGLMLFFPARSNTSHYWRSAAHSWVHGQCLRSESEWREPPLGRDSCHQYVFHFTVTKTSVIYWCLPCSIPFPVKARGSCLVSRRMQSGLCPVISTMHLNCRCWQKMQFPYLKQWQSPVPHPLKMLCFWFSFTKATTSFGVLFAISRSVGKKCAKIFLELGGKGDYWLQREGKREHVTQRGIPDVKCLFQGHLWHRDFDACYSLAGACIQHHSSAPNT